MKINFIAFAKNLNFNAGIPLNEIKLKVKVLANCLLNAKLFTLTKNIETLLIISATL